MMKQPIIVLLGTVALAVAFLADARAQENVPFGPENYEQDFQMFSPFTLDLDNMVDKQYSGYFFNYDKLFGSYSGERTTVGSGDASTLAEVIYYTNNPIPGTTVPPGQGDIGTPP